MSHLRYLTFTAVSSQSPRRRKEHDGGVGELAVCREKTHVLHYEVHAVVFETNTPVRIASRDIVPERCERESNLGFSMAPLGITISLEGWTIYQTLPH